MIAATVPYVRIHGRKVKMSKSTVFILAGGAGTRLKPLSLTGEGKLPKQFLRLFGEKTLLQEAVSRIPPGNSIVIVPEHAYSNEVRKQADDIGIDVGIFSEPFGCNTGPAVIAAAAKTAVLEKNPSQVICFLPADHMMDAEIFRKLFDQAVQRAETSNNIITIGITPTRPETGYGYIRVKTPEHNAVQQVREFVEKPDKETAKTYLDSGDYFWNAGIFFGKAQVFLDLASIHCPEIIGPIRQHMSDSSFDIEQSYRQIKSEKNTKSIDYALMEKIPESIELLTAPAALKWNDLGSWESLSPYLEADSEHNQWLIESPPEVTQSSEVMVFNYTDLPVHVADLRGLVVVVTDNGILIRPKNV